MDNIFGNVVLFERQNMIQHKMGLLRRVSTDIKLFRELITEITMLMGYEVIKSLSLEEISIRTPMATTEAKEVEKYDIPFLTIILRAGLSMMPGMLLLMPQAQVGMIGLNRIEDEVENKTDKRDEVRLNKYYFKLPPDADRRPSIILDPMLASGTTASESIRLLKEAGVKDIKFMCLVTCKEGLEKVTKDHPDVKFYCAAIDPELLKNNYISPGLGDAGDRWAFNA